MRKMRDGQQAHQMKRRRFLVTAAFLTCLMFVWRNTGRGSSKGSTADQCSALGKAFGIVVDAGSTGTRAHVFEVRKGVVVSEKFFSTDAALGRDGVVSSLGDVIGSAGEPLSVRQKKCTDIFLGATEGLRKLGDERADSILTEAKDYLKNLGYRSAKAELLRGEDEGRYAWMTVRYLTKETLPILDVGGGSVQFVYPSGASCKSTFWSGIGLNSVNLPGCGSDFAACKSSALALIPPLDHPPNHPKIYAFSYFHKLAHQLSPTTPSRLAEHAVSKCPSDPVKCKEFGYLAALLDRLGIEDPTEIVVAKKVEYNGVLMETAWPLGAFLSNVKK